MMAFAKRKLANLNFDNTSLKELPLDKVRENYIRRAVKNACYSRVDLTPVKNPKVVAVSKEALELIDLDIDETKNEDFAEYFGGNKPLPGSDPAAHCYCGHQFGHFAGQLGDGRAILLGEIVNHKGERYELQFKGAGQTPYSRDADGRAVLRSSIREFLCSEGMFHLGVPTTRAATLVTSDSYVARDLKYDGNPIRERATVVLRIAPTFIRFGSFQIVLPQDPLSGRSGPSTGNALILRDLVHYVIKYHYPEIWKMEVDDEKKYEEFYRQVVIRTAKMVAEWQCVGFVHGVMNTDNMSILGLTIDYGPFGFLDAFNPEFISNATDQEGRYSYKNQPSICKWNLEKLAEPLNYLIPLEVSQKILEETFDAEYEKHYMQKMKKKLGLFKEISEDKELVDELLSTMKDTGGDFTNIFRILSQVALPVDEMAKVVEKEVLDYILSQLISLPSLLKLNAPRITPRELQMMVSMIEQAPWMLQMMGKSPQFVNDELKRMERYDELKKITIDEKREKDTETWTKWLMKYKARLQTELAGVSDVEELKKQRVSTMNSNNPKYILRNYIAQQAIALAEKGDFSEVNTLHEVLKRPYEEQPEVKEKKYDSVPPDWASNICLTCSS